VDALSRAIWPGVEGATPFKAYLCFNQMARNCRSLIKGGYLYIGFLRLAGVILGIASKRDNLI
jgi:hypothetical protein